jgi:RHS repeat-associated protein
MAKQFISYRYDAVGNRVGMTDPQGGRFTYSYDFMSRLTALQNPQGERTSYIYDAGGRRTGVVNANCTRTSTVYDNLSRVTQVVNQKSDGTVLSSFGYAYDLSGNRKLVVEADGRRTSYTYDAAGQLTGEHRGGTGGYQHTFAYDRSGNRTLKVEDGVRTTFVYDAASQMKYSEAAGGRTTYVYDGDGNQQSIQPPAGGRTTYVWDYENRMQSALLPAGTRNTMTYDPDGLRIRLDESTGSKLFLWDGQKYLATMNASGIIQVVYTNEPTTYGNLVSAREGGQTTHYHFDALGSTRTLTDASQNVLQQYSYGAWGNILGSPVLLTPFLWVGQVGYHWDSEAQNHYVRARYYRPVIARWVSVDPRFFVDGLNRFTYCSLSPVGGIDPSGTSKLGNPCFTLRVFASAYLIKVVVTPPKFVIWDLTPHVENIVKKELAKNSPRTLYAISANTADILCWPDHKCCRLPTFSITPVHGPATVTQKVTHDDKEVAKVTVHLYVTLTGEGAIGICVPPLCPCPLAHLLFWFPDSIDIHKYMGDYTLPDINLSEIASGTAP